jgi:hypothetical protein
LRLRAGQGRLRIIVHIVVAIFSRLQTLVWGTCGRIVGARRTSVGILVLCAISSVVKLGDQ